MKTRIHTGRFNILEKTLRLFRANFKFRLDLINDTRPIQ